MGGMNCKKTCLIGIFPVITTATEVMGKGICGGDRSRSWMQDNKQDSTKKLNMELLDSDVKSGNQRPKDRNCWR